MNLAQIRVFHAYVKLMLSAQANSTGDTFDAIGKRFEEIILTLPMVGDPHNTDDADIAVRRMAEQPRRWSIPPPAFASTGDMYKGETARCWHDAYARVLKESAKSVTALIVAEKDLAKANQRIEELQEQLTSRNSQIESYKQHIDNDAGAHAANLKIRDRDRHKILSLRNALHDLITHCERQYGLRQPPLSPIGRARLAWEQFE